MAQEILDYDIVRVSSLNGKIGTVRKFVEGLHGNKWAVLFFDGQTLELPEADLVRTGVSESPLDYYEVVIIQPQSGSDPEVAQIAGCCGAIVGVALSEGQVWYYSVVLQDGYVWCLDGRELVGTDVVLSQELLYGDGASALTIEKSGDPEIGQASDITSTTVSPLRVDLGQFRNSLGE